MFELKDYQFELPPELIAQFPVSPRDHSRLLVIDRKTGSFQHKTFKDLSQLLITGDQLVFNNAKVIPARLHGKKETGAAAEILLLESCGGNDWLAMSRPAKKLKLGTKIVFSKSFFCEVIEERQEGIKVVRLNYEGDFESALNQHGEMPLPPYIQRLQKDEDDLERYQTVYAKRSGAAAAPTAGLHFTHELLNQLTHAGVDKTEITLYVGIGTFRPVSVPDIREHRMHSEKFEISSESAEKLNKQVGRRICVGTTSCRTLESSAISNDQIREGTQKTDIFIYPGFNFKKTDALLTNFHLPGSSLLMLVSAFAGYSLTMNAYREAIKEKYRFFSYGDAMLIL